MQEFGRKKKLPVYKAKINPTDTSIDGVDAISLVTNPAIESDFMIFKNEETDKTQLKFNIDFEFKRTDKLNRFLTGPVMIPDKLIYRKDKDGKEFYMYFDKDTIQSILKKYMKQGLTNSVTHQHELPTKCGYFVEHWLVSNSSKDKSNFLNIGKFEEGTWMATFYVEDLNYFENEVATGNVKGFSVECWLDLEIDKDYKNFDSHNLFNSKEIMLSIFNRKKETKEIKFDVKELNKFYQTRKLKFEVTQLLDGTPIELDETAMIAYILSPEGERVSVAPEGLHELIDGRVIVVTGTEGAYEVDTPAEEAEVLELQAEDGAKIVIDLKNKKLIQYSPVVKENTEAIELKKEVAKLQSELKQIKLAPQPTKLEVVENSEVKKENKINIDFAKKFNTR